VPAESRNELKGRDQKEFAKRSGNKAFAKGKTANAVKAQKGLTRFSDNQPHNEAAKAEKASHGKANSKNRKPR
jgi:hypothetical protein